APLSGQNDAIEYSSTLATRRPLNMASSEAEIQRQKEMQQAEELLFSGRQELGFAKGLFLGNFVADWVMPYPRLDPTRQTELESALSEVRQMLDRDLDSDWIHRNAERPPPPTEGLSRTRA